MAFTAKVTAINLIGSNYIVSVLFSDDASGYTSSSSFNYPTDGSTTQQQVVNDITAAGTIIKNNLTHIATLQSKVGSIITI